MANIVDPDQTAPLGAVWSGSTLFAHIRLSENLGSLRYLLDLLIYVLANFSNLHETELGPFFYHVIKRIFLKTISSS